MARKRPQRRHRRAAARRARAQRASTVAAGRRASCTSTPGSLEAPRGGATSRRSARRCTCAGICAATPSWSASRPRSCSSSTAQRHPGAASGPDTRSRKPTADDSAKLGARRRSSWWSASRWRALVLVGPVTLVARAAVRSSCRLPSGADHGRRGESRRAATATARCVLAPAGAAAPLPAAARRAVVARWPQPAPAAPARGQTTAWRSCTPPSAGPRSTTPAGRRLLYGLCVAAAAPSARAARRRCASVLGNAAGVRLEVDGHRHRSRTGAPVPMTPHGSIAADGRRARSAADDWSD